MLSNATNQPKSTVELGYIYNEYLIMHYVLVVCVAVHGPDHSNYDGDEHNGGE